MKSSGDHAALHQDWRWRWWVAATGANLGCWWRCDNGGNVKCDDGGGEVGLSLRNLLTKKKE